jgi:formylglycine-generating enzyme required for sulfatase activity
VVASAIRRRGETNVAASADDVTFGRELVNAGLLAEPAVKRYLEAHARTERFSEPRPFSRFLVEAGVLTRRQAEAVLRRSRGEARPKRIGDLELPDDRESWENVLGRVFEAYDPGRDETVDLLLIDAKGVRLPSEADLAAARRAAPPRWARPVAAGAAGGKPFVAWEASPGRRLSEFLEELEVMSVEQALDLAEELLHAVGDARREGLAHGALRPDSIVIEEDGNVRVLELGIGPRLAREAVRLAEAGEDVDEAFFIAPEVSADGPAPDTRADLFSVGAVLYDALTGSAPGEREAEFVPVHKKNPACPKAVSSFISGLLAGSPVARPSGVGEALAQLRRLRGETPAGVGGPGWLRTRGWIYGAGVAAGWALVAFAMLAAGAAEPEARPLTEEEKAERLAERREEIAKQEAALRDRILGARQAILEDRTRAEKERREREAREKRSRRLREAADALDRVRALQTRGQLGDALKAAKGAAVEYADTDLAQSFESEAEKLQELIDEIGAEEEARRRKERALDLARKGTLALEAGRLDEAERAFSEAVGLGIEGGGPESAKRGLEEVRFLRAKVGGDEASRAGRLEEALAAYEEALSIRDDTAVKVARDATKRRIESGKLIAVAEKLRADGELGKALSAYKSARKLAPTESWGEIDEAVREIELELRRDEAVREAGDDLAAGRFAAVWDGLVSLERRYPDDREVRDLRRSAKAELQKTSRVTLDGVPGGMELCLVLGGEFRMGSESGDPDERPVHAVYVSTFYVARHEVTNAQYEAFDPDHRKKRGRYGPAADHPVAHVSWTEARDFCVWLARRSGKTVRLPTEAEWEKAARSTDERPYPWGDEPAEGKDGKRTVYRANLGRGKMGGGWKRDGFLFAAPVTAFAEYPSPSGCLNMAGNVWEWCFDRYDEFQYARGARRDPRGAVTGSDRVMRGGSWSNDPEVLRCTNRNFAKEGARAANIGFRVAMEAP